MARVVVPRTMESSTTMSRLPVDVLVQRVQLAPHRVDPGLLVGVDEGPPDVAVLHQPLAVGDVGCAGVALGRRDPRVGHAHHHVGVDRGLVGQQLAHPPPRAVHLAAVQAGVGAGEVDELEDAQAVGDLVARRTAGATGRRSGRS